MRWIASRPVAVTAIAVLLMGLVSACDGSLPVPRPNAPISNRAAPVVPPPFTPDLVSAPLAGHTAGELHVVGGFTTIDISAAAIGNDLFRASADPGSGQVPVAAVTGNVVTVTEHGTSSGNGVATVQIVLNPKVAWSVSLDGGASVAVIDLSGARVTSVGTTQGVSSLELTLPQQAGTTPLSIAAGASAVRVHLPTAEAVRTTLSAGAGSVTVNGVTHSGIAAGTSFASVGWDSAADRVDIECSAGVGTVIVDQA